MSTRTVPVVLAIGQLAFGIACAQPEASDTLRVSGHVEATEVRLAPDVARRCSAAEPENVRSRRA